MTLSDLRENYERFSEKTSALVRNLGFAGIALIWAFKTATKGKSIVPSELIIPGVLIVTSLALDLLHGVVGTAIWGIYNRIKEKEFEERAAKDRDFDPEEEDFLAPSPINWPALLLFWGKIAAMLASYVLLIQFLIRRVI